MCEVHLAIVLGSVTDDLAGVGDTPKVVCVAAHPVEDLKRHTVLVVDVRRFDALHEQLHLIALTEIGTESAVHYFDLTRLDTTQIGVVAGTADA